MIKRLKTICMGPILKKLQMQCMKDQAALAKERHLPQYDEYSPNQFKSLRVRLNDVLSDAVRERRFSCLVEEPGGGLTTCHVRFHEVYDVALVRANPRELGPVTDPFAVHLFIYIRLYDVERNKILYFCLQMPLMLMPDSFEDEVELFGFCQDKKLWNHRLFLDKYIPLLTWHPESGTFAQEYDAGVSASVNKWGAMLRYNDNCRLTLRDLRPWIEKVYSTKKRREK